MRVDLQLVQIRKPARERRQLQLVAVHLTVHEAVIAGRRHDGAGYAIVLLFEQQDGFRRLAFSFVNVASQVPATSALSVAASG